jgi:hypothetical protein
MVTSAGEHASAQAVHQEALAAAETLDNDYLRAGIFEMLGLDAATVGDMTDAGTLRRCRPAPHRYPRLQGSAYCLSGLAGLVLNQGKTEASARLLGSSDHLRQVIGAAVWPGMQSSTKPNARRPAHHRDGHARRMQTVVARLCAPAPGSLLFGPFVLRGEGSSTGRRRF